jgi:predicted glycogen debranching enzyme
MTPEWLCANGLGSYASGTRSDILTRRYHGLLVAALEPPLGRRVLLSKFDTSVEYCGAHTDLSANRWHDGTLAPAGDVTIVDFYLDGAVPVWAYAIADALLEQRIWMEHGAQTSYVQWTLRDASAPVDIALKAYVNDRDYHALTRAYDVADVARIEGETATLQMGNGATWYLHAGGAHLENAGAWYYGFRYDAETERGLDDTEDLYHALTIRAQFAEPGERLLICASLDSTIPVPSDPHVRERALLGDWRNANPRMTNPPLWIEQLVLAADAFIVARTVNGIAGSTVIAGYHWFGDWGRDTMIALPGLALSTGRAGVARSILQTFARLVDGGMLPNRFPDTGAAPEYNTVDAALWFIETVRLYHVATNDRALVESIFDRLHDIIDGYSRGTRYGIAVDPSDGLVRAGEPGVQLTWMDAKVGEWVVTPRIGKPIEINALWYNALCTMDGFAQMLGRDATFYRNLSTRARASFERFWNAEANYPFDVLDGPQGNDASLRPNAVYAVASRTNCGLRWACVRLRHRTHRTLLTTAVRRTIATPLIIVAPPGRSSQEHLRAPTRMLMATGRALCASSKRWVRTSIATGWELWLKSPTATHRTTPAAASHKPGASVKYCEPGTPYRRARDDRATDRRARPHART